MISNLRDNKYYRGLDMEYAEKHFTAKQNHNY